MITQRYKFYPTILLFAILMLALTACRSSKINRTDTDTILRTTISSYLSAMNEEDIETLRFLYAEDFKSYAPLYETSKAELLKSIQNGFNQQNNRISAKVIEVINGQVIATAQLAYMIINENQEVIYAQDLLQIWKKEATGWKLSRILFYQGDEIPKAGDIKF